MAEKYGVRWALASDIGGGPFLSMFDVIQSFVQQNEAAGVPASYVKALYRSTSAGADILGLGIGRGDLLKDLILMRYGSQLTTRY